MAAALGLSCLSACLLHARAAVTCETVAAAAHCPAPSIAAVLCCWSRYDLEDMVPQAQRPDTAALLSCLQLSSEQRQQIALAYDCFRSQRAAVLQQQERIICDLQAVLAASSLQAAGTHQTDASTQRSADAAAGNPAAASCPGLLPAAAALAGAAAAGGTATAGTCPRHGAEAGPVQWTGSSAADAEVGVGHSSGSSDGAHLRPSTYSSSSSSYSRLHIGLLDLELAEQADDLLQQLQRVVRLDREAARTLIYGTWPRKHGR